MSKLVFDSYSVVGLERMKAVDLERYAIHTKGTIANLCDAMIYAKEELATLRAQLAASQAECERLRRENTDLEIKLERGA